MKMLAINLLRLGDIVQSLPAIYSLKRRNPNAEVHLLINKSCSGIAALLPWVDRFHYFDRDYLQESIADASRPVFSSYGILNSLVTDLNAQKFTQVINFSHTRLSGYLAGVIQCEERIGLSQNGSGFGRIDGSWFELLDQQAEAFTEDAFHYNDIFCFSVEEHTQEVPYGLFATNLGEQEAESIWPRSSNVVGVQVYSSDKKKNWPPERFAKMLRRFWESSRTTQILLFGAEFERESIEKMATQMAELGLPVRSAILSIQGLFSALKRSKMLITGDTFTKHLATAARTKTLELSLGSSDWRRTGAWGEGHLILQPKTFCSPCKHRNPCSQSSHQCAEELSEESVAEAAVAYFDDDWSRISMIAQTVKNEIELRRTERLQSGIWMAVNQAEKSDDMQKAESLVSRMAAKMQLDGTTGDGKVPEAFGTYGRRILACFVKDSVNRNLVRSIFKDLIKQFEGELEGEIDLQSIRARYSVCPNWRGLAQLADRALESANEQGSFYSIRQRQSAQRSIQRSWQIALRLARVVHQELGYDGPQETQSITEEGRI